ncbi:MAG: hypothetical protein AAF387_22225 [Pseudomonadota bacterium]
MPCPIDNGLVGPIKTIRKYDDVVTAPLHGFEDADDYYEQSSCRQYLSTIRIPTLIIHSTDDPLVPASAIPSQQELADSVDMECYRRGGHVAFISGGFPLRPRYWLDERIADFLAS